MTVPRIEELHVGTRVITVLLRIIAGTALKRPVVEKNMDVPMKRKYGVRDCYASVAYSMWRRRPKSLLGFRVQGLGFRVKP